MMSDFYRLPEDVTRFLLEYLCYHERIQLMTINTTFASTFLRSIRIITKSILRIKNDRTTRERILSLIEDPYQQLIIKIEPKVHEHEEDDSGAAITVEGEGKIINKLVNNQVSFNRIQEVSLSLSSHDATSIEIVKDLAERNHDPSFGLKRLNLNMVIEYRLGSIHEPDVDERKSKPLFPYVPNLHTANFIAVMAYLITPQYGSVHKLSLRGCNLLDDISAFGNIYDLSIIRCSGGRDISGLQNNHIIVIEGCDEIIDYSQSFQNSVFITIKCSFDHCKPVQIRSLNRVQSLRLEGFSSVLPLQLPRSLRCYSTSCISLDSSELTGFEFLSYLCISDSPHVHSMQPFGRIPTLDIYNLRNLSSLEGLGQGNRHVMIEACDNITDFSPLRFMERVTIHSCTGFTNAADINHVKYVTLKYATFHMNLSPLGQNVHHLCLVHISDFFFPNLQGLEKVPTVELICLCLRNPHGIVQQLQQLLQGQHQKIVFRLNSSKTNQEYLKHLFLSEFPTHDSYVQCIDYKENAVVYFAR